MRLRETFTLYKRRLGSGKVVWYYQCYDGRGRRLCGHSTGQGTKTAAREYCLGLLKGERLLPVGAAGRVPTFREFAEGFWDFDKSEYLRSLLTLNQHVKDKCKMPGT
jgi:hypothetical protein